MAAAERKVTAALIRSLMVVEKRRLYLREGCSSLYTYCTKVLKLCDGAACNRIEVARAALEFPALIDAIDTGSVTLTAARLLAPHLTPENRDGLLAAATHKTTREVRRIVAPLQPRADAPPRIQPIAEGRYEVQFTIGEDTYERLRHVQGLIWHITPNGDLATIFERALALLARDLEKKRHGATQSPRNARPVSRDSRHIPSAVKRAVQARDQGRCAFVGTEGRCTETAGLQYHHLDPYAVGGEATVDNVELRCAAHNRYEADLVFGHGASVAREAVGPAHWASPRAGQGLYRILITAAARRTTRSHRHP